MKPAEKFSLAAVATRNGQPDAWHFAAAAVATPAGRVVTRLGDPEIGAFPRSGVKPFQAMPLVVGGGCERFALEAADLALICGSHGGTVEHVERALSLLERGGFGAADLGCAPHAPFDKAAAAELQERRQEPTRLHNNCSGKHAGMLLACRLLGLPESDYLAPEHPLQRMVLTELQRFARLNGTPIEIAVDGCGAPTPRLSLAAAARAYAALADPVAAGLDDEHCRAAKRIVEAMTTAPQMVAGTGRFTTRLMEVTGGRILAKEGADGFYAASVRGPVALGLALKIADGSEAPRDGVVLEILRQLGSLSGGELDQLDRFYRRPIRNWGGEPVGELAPDLELQENKQ
jgi:L-asparaginase II